MISTKTRLRVLALGVGVALLTAGCSSESSTPDAAPAPAPSTDAPAEATGPLKIGFISHSQDITDLFGQLRVGFELTLQDAGVDYQLFASAPPNSGDHQGMDRILTDLQALDLDYVVFGPTAFEINQPRLVDLENLGVKIIMTDYPPPADGADIDPLTWVIYDHFEMGKVVGKQAGVQLCEEGVTDAEVAVFWGPAASEISELRGAGVLEGMDEGVAGCGASYTVVNEVYTDFNRELAFNTTEGVITRNPNLKVIVGMNSNTALGIMEALTSIGQLEGRIVFGMGGQLDELTGVCNGTLAHTAFRDPRDMGRLAGEALLNDIAGNNDATPEISYTAIPLMRDCDEVYELTPAALLEVERFWGGLNEGLRRP
jgi:ABC-type sugar transport system substrate-binding protein